MRSMVEGYGGAAAAGAAGGGGGGGGGGGAALEMWGWGESRLLVSYA